VRELAGVYRIRNGLIASERVYLDRDETPRRRRTARVGRASSRLVQMRGVADRAKPSPTGVPDSAFLMPSHRRDVLRHRATPPAAGRLVLSASGAEGSSLVAVYGRLCAARWPAACWNLPGSLASDYCGYPRGGSRRPVSGP
jgi:hypothetical protein